LQNDELIPTMQIERGELPVDYNLSN